MLLAWETLNIFLLTGMSNIDILLIKKNMNVAGYSIIQNKFAFTNLMGNLKSKRKNLKKDITHFFFLN